jgi:hypothetical protein
MPVVCDCKLIEKQHTAAYMTRGWGGGDGGGTIQYNTILPTGLKPASALASEPCSAHEGCGRDCTQVFLR